jgi:fructose-1,6-bisphosphatase/inositol monophosphatase family enzyme
MKYPLLDQYWAKVGGGAFMNGIRLGARPQHLKDLSGCSVCLQCKPNWTAPLAKQLNASLVTGGSGRHPNEMEPKYGNAKNLYAGRDTGGKEVHAIRIIGSSTGALACLASGQIDVFQYVPIPYSGNRIRTLIAAIVVVIGTPSASLGMSA